MGRNVLDLKRPSDQAAKTAGRVRSGERLTHEPFSAGTRDTPAPVGLSENEIAAQLIEAMIQSSPENEPAVEMTAPAPAPVGHPLNRADHAVTPVRRRTIAVPSGLLSLTPWVLGAVLVIAGLLYVSQSGSRIKERVVEESNAAIGSLMEAGDAAQQLDWEGASVGFHRASRQLDDAGGVLNLLGPSVTGVLSNVPGLRDLGTGRDILTAGRLLSGAGASVADALTTFADLNAAAGEATDIRAGEALAALDVSLGRASRDVTEARRLLDGVDTARLPEAEAAKLAKFRSQLPVLSERLNDAAGAVAFMRRFLGTDRARRYLVLFENTSELRPTGGFPGTYGLLSTEGGRIRDWRADDIYNPDGQISELVIPPVQLQHITPSWGMRDAAWWADWPVSARKSASFWQRGGGASVDGVLAVQPALLASLLRATGPISLPDYDVVVSAETFLPILQTEVEENRPSGKPKQIIADLAPVVLEKLASLPPERWPALLESLRASLDRREVLMWFSDEDLVAYADAKGWSGRVHDTEGDYVMAVISNIKGAKTDAVTDSAMKIEGRIQNGALIHRLTLTRRHDGHTSPYGFYNKPNFAYVRILTPKGSMLRGITGNARPAHPPLISDYEKQGAQLDADLAALEETYRYDGVRGVTISEEAGKTGFGFWMTVLPGETESVQLEYEVPASAFADPYRLYVQKQPGLRMSSVEVTLDKPGFQVVSDEPELTEWPDSWRLTDTSPTDLALTADLKQ